MRGMGSGIEERIGNRTGRGRDEKARETRHEEQEVKEKVEGGIRDTRTRMCKHNYRRMRTETRGTMLGGEE